jgi:hypothetical protein
MLKELSLPVITIAISNSNQYRKPPTHGRQIKLAVSTQKNLNDKDVITAKITFDFTKISNAYYFTSMKEVNSIIY